MMDTNLRYSTETSFFFNAKLYRLTLKTIYFQIWRKKNAIVCNIKQIIKITIIGKNF